MRLRWLLFLSALCLAAIVLSGCGGGSHKPAHPRSTQHRYGTAAEPRAHAPGFGLPPRGAKPQALAPTAVSTLEQFDSVTVATVPSYARAVAGYTSGFWPTYGPLVAAFPHAYHISIAVNIAHQAECLDDEPGDATPSQAGWWVNWELNHNWTKPCVYASLSDMAAVRANITAWGIARSRYFLWDADWTYFAHLDAGYDATQWTDRSLGRNLDESTATLAFLGAKPTPPPDPYAHYIKPPFEFGSRICISVSTCAPKDHASEYNTVKTWDRFHCKNPVRRSVCKSTHYHLQLLRARAYFVATHVVVRGKWRSLAKPRWSYPKDQPLGSRFAGLSHRLASH